jgi:Gpi18-like mannosyltransferase
MGQIVERFETEQFMSFRSLKGFLINKYILSGLIVRFLISILFAHYNDFDIIVNAARDFFNFGIIAYFVKWAYGFLSYVFLLGFYFPARLFPDYIFVFGQNWMLSEKFFLRLPLNISDLFTSYILYCLMVESKKKKYAMPVALLYWLNPLSIYVNCIYGIFDGITIFFALLAFYHFIHGKYYLSALELGISFGIKYHSLIFIPIFLIILWKEERRKIPIFLFILAVLSVFSFLLPAFVYYDPNTHYLAFTFSPSQLNYTRALPVGRELGNPNMSYLNLLTRSSLKWPISSYNDIWAWVLFLFFFSIFTFLIFRKRFFEHYQSRVSFLAAYAVGAYMIYYLTYIRIHQHYALWTVPFLIILFAFGNLNRFLVIIFNFLPLVQAFHSRDTIFSYINGNYSPYGVGWVSAVAIGLLFSISCLLILQDLFKETLIKTYQPLRKLRLSFQQLSNKNMKVFPTLLLISVFLLIISAIYITGPPYWSTAPISYPIEWVILPPRVQVVLYFSSIPKEWLILPSFLQLALSYILLFDAVPLALVFGLSLNYKKNVKKTSYKWKYLLFFISIALTIILIFVILQATLPYITNPSLRQLIPRPWLIGRSVPVYGPYSDLYKNGGFITSVFLLLACLLAIDIILPKISKNKEYEVVD